MADTKIEWCSQTNEDGSVSKGKTWNPVTGCTRASEGCDNCYAATMTRRLAAMGQEKYQGLIGEGKRHFNGVIKLHEDELQKPLRWRKPVKVFVNSMSDLFHPGVPFEFIDQVFAVMALCPQHTFQILTKRPERMAEYLTEVETGRYTQFGKHAGTALPDIERAKGRVWQLCFAKQPSKYYSDRLKWPLPNVWLGTSVEDQAAADERIPYLLRCPAAVRFLSCEPLLESLDLREYLGIGDCNKKWCNHPFVDWTIIGGESGPGARPCNIDWIRSIVSQCRDANVPVFVKQLGSVPAMDAQAWRKTQPTRVLNFLNHHKMPADMVPLLLRSSKGGDLEEWPEDLRVRETPKTTEVQP